MPFEPLGRFIEELRTLSSHSGVSKEAHKTRKDIAMKDLNRREFITASSLIAATGALGLAGCTPSEGSASPLEQDSASASIPKSWDKEADFVVLGSGTALTGALKGAAEGLSVVVIEKATLVGGTTALSGGQVWVPGNDYSETPDDLELARTYMAKTAGGLSTDAIIDAYISTASEMVNFIADETGVEWSVSPRIDYHATWEGASRDTRSLSCVIDGKRSGAHFTNPEAEALEALGGEILTSTAATRLVARPIDGGLMEVLGVIAVNEAGEEIAIKAKKSVLVGTGGFSYNYDMVLKYHTIPIKGNMCVPESTGDGILMAQAVGADLTMMPWGWGQIAFKELSEKYFNEGVCSTTVSLYAYQTKPGSIFVNRQGKRFCDEASDYDSMWFGFQGQLTTGEMELTNVPAWYICDHTVREALADPSKGDIFFGVGLEGDLPSWGYQGDTIEDLAGKIGIDPTALKAQIDKYNSDVAAGIDVEFHRGESEFENYNMMNAGPTLGALVKPPFYAAEIIPTFQGTKGGIKMNEKGQALHVTGQPIPRLYACGNTTGCGTPGKYYTGAGGTNGPGMVFAYISAMETTGLEDWA
jgi:succinate dehydrogenase/fumarate reductase flavoprotein subunit